MDLNQQRMIQINLQELENNFPSELQWGRSNTQNCVAAMLQHLWAIETIQCLLLSCFLLLLLYRIHIHDVRSKHWKYANSNCATAVFFFGGGGKMQVNFPKMAAKKLQGVFTRKGNKFHEKLESSSKEKRAVRIGEVALQWSYCC